MSFEKIHSTYVTETVVVIIATSLKQLIAHKTKQLAKKKLKNRIKSYLFAVKSNTLNRLFQPYRVIRRESKTTYNIAKIIFR